ncbi:unnamed protein product [Closterium sp. NIES-64]|nr:unnamed protein product [Closterium sp. NIES-64]
MHRSQADALLDEDTCIIRCGIPHCRRRVCLDLSAISSTPRQCFSRVCRPTRQALEAEREEKRAAKLRPTRKNGKVIGDKWASGKMVFKTVMYSASSYAGIYACNIFKIDSGGQTPGSSGVPSCTDSPVGGNSPLPWVNVTSAKAGHNKLYSFKLKLQVPLKTKAEASAFMQQFTEAGEFFRVGHDRNGFALCGKVKKVK